MDADPHVSPDISPVSLSSLPLPQIMQQMAYASEDAGWLARLISAGSDKKKLRKVLFSVVNFLAGIVSRTTSLRVITPTRDEAEELVENLNDGEVNEWVNIVRNEDWATLVTHLKLTCYKPYTDKPYNFETLKASYMRNYVGDFATDFIKYLGQADRGTLGILYAKAISVVQSSGTGKSRMLTEVGKQIFTLPICLRKHGDEGYPPGDKSVVEYFSALPKGNDLNVTAHAGIACFLGAAHRVMLETLQEAWKEKGLTGQKLLDYWHGIMEPTEAYDGREAFYEEVVKQANLMKLKVEIPWSGGEDGKPLPSKLEIYETFSNFYQLYTKSATEELMKFLSTVLPAAISITYFDEAHELGLHSWIILRLVSLQLPPTKMWYTFIGKEKIIPYFAPRPGNKSSLRLVEELARLLPPYIDLGFDQQAIAKGKAPVSVSMGDMQTLKFLSQYGRPLWSAHVERHPGDLIKLAALELQNGEDFDVEDNCHVFSVLSQRLCLDPVMAASEAMELMDRSVAHHMRLLTGFSANYNKSYTHSPSEPILVMGSIDILYNKSNPVRLQDILNTLSRDLCGAGLIEKGILGELGARILLLFARDFATPRDGDTGIPNLLKPIRVLDFLYTLFRKDVFTPPDKVKFENAFGEAHVNFTHWINTLDTIPKEANEQLLTNLWARGAALQCCFSQEAFDLLIPVYDGPIYPELTFDPSRLSTIWIQIKDKFAGDGKAECAIRPIGVSRDRHQPVPYLAILMELGNESYYQESGSRIKYTASKPPGDDEFENLCDARDKANKELETYHKKKNAQKDTLDNLKKAANDAQFAVDSCNRYSISARGIGPNVYGILRTADIVNEFKTLLKIIMPLPADPQSTRLHMRPLERMSDASNHTDWMSEYVV